MIIVISVVLCVLVSVDISFRIFIGEYSEGFGGITFFGLVDL